MVLMDNASAAEIHAQVCLDGTTPCRKNILVWFKMPVKGFTKQAEGGQP